MQQRWTSKHNIIGLQCNNAKNKISDVKLDRQVSGAGGNLRCFIHPTQDLQLYCLNCDQVACHNCTILLHKGHKFEAIDNAKQHVINSLRESVGKSKKFQQIIHDSICELAESIAKINADADIVQVSTEFKIFYFKEILIYEICCFVFSRMKWKISLKAISKRLNRTEMHFYVKLTERKKYKRYQ